ncbi:hypothetical protein BYT27DRAFT_7240815 [Phlegmacium glaucopus]|nr:hypothetical protein BYT27DRAFT_7240815 [Phlegmacium glaucopus]
MDFPVDNHRKWASEVQWTVGDYVTAATNNNDYGWCCVPSVVIKRTDVQRGNVTVPPHQNAGNDDHRWRSVVVKEVIYFHPPPSIFSQRRPFSANTPISIQHHPFSVGTALLQPTPPVFSQHCLFSANTPHFHPTPPVFSRYRPSSTNTTCFQPTLPVFSQRQPFSANTPHFHPTPPVFSWYRPSSTNTTRFQPTPPVFSQRHPLTAH